MKLTSAWLLLLLTRFASAAEECEAPPADSTYASDPPSYFPTEFLSVPVRAIRKETHNSFVITFGLPEGVSLNLPISSAILMRAPGAGKNGGDAIKPYNPISSNAQLGSFDLLIKVYEGGTVSRWAGALQPGDRVAFKQVKANVKPFRYPCLHFATHGGGNSENGAWDGARWHRYSDGFVTNLPRPRKLHRHSHGQRVMQHGCALALRDSERHVTIQTHMLRCRVLQHSRHC